MLKSTFSSQTYRKYGNTKRILPHQIFFFRIPYEQISRTAFFCNSIVLENNVYFGVNENVSKYAFCFFFQFTLFKHLRSKWRDPYLGEDADRTRYFPMF